MNKQIALTLLTAALALPAAAQETYQSTRLTESELNGTARYVGMGGAMEALGADISTISSNPAGLGLFRRSQVSISGGLVTQQDASTHPNINGISASINGKKTNASFDQVGFVWSRPSDNGTFIIFGFNYHKGRNFDQLLNAGAALNNASQNKLTAVKYGLGVPDASWNGVDASYSDPGLGLFEEGKDGQPNQQYFINGTGYLMGKYESGYIGNYDFNFSANLKDRVYLGLTLGIHDVHYNSGAYYTEDLVGGGTSEMQEILRMTGTGLDVKAGVIFRPSANSPFRIGAYVHSPIFYELSTAGDIDVAFSGSNPAFNDQYNWRSAHSATLDYKVNTPWKFGLSLGHTVGNYLALGLTYEYQDYSTIDNRVNNGEYFDYYSGPVTTSSSDYVMNEHTKQSLRGVSLLKAGVEFKPEKQWAVRLGYNYQSPIFRTDAIRDGGLESQGVASATSTDFTNWKATHRFTAGVGYQVGKVGLDLAYQYSQTNGEFFPFMSYTGDVNPDMDNEATPANVSFKRNQLLFTLSYKF